LKQADNYKIHCGHWKIYNIPENELL
jgi:hypothetical protein